MPDPLQPIRPGDPVSTVLSAGRHNLYSKAARTVFGALPVRWKREPKPRGRRWQEFVRIQYDGTVDLQKYELVRLMNSPHYLDLANAPTPPVLRGYQMNTNASQCYGNWAVLHEAVQVGQSHLALACVGGYTPARISARSVGGTVRNWGYADMHPSPADETREVYRLASRCHGKARIHDWNTSRDYAYVYLEPDPTVRSFPVVAKNTHHGTGSYDREVYPVGPTHVDTGDPLEVGGHSTQLLWPVGIGYDDSVSACSRGLAQYDPQQSWRLTQWQDRHWVKLQNNVDQLLSGGTIPSWKLVDWPGGTEYGDAFEMRIGRDLQVSFAQPSDDQRATYNLEEGSYFTFRTVHSYKASWGMTRWPFIEEQPGMFDAAYGTVRIIHDASYSGTGPYRGWYWCDGSSHSGAPDYRDRFIVGEGPGDGDAHLRAHSGTGGYAYHGDGVLFEENNHTDHLTNTVQSGSGATAVVQGSHDSTNNEPPWYAVAFAIRLPPDT